MNKHNHAEQVETLLPTTVEAQSIFVNSEDCHLGFEHVLQNLLKLTDRQYGFIGEVLTNGAGHHFFNSCVNVIIAKDIANY